MMARSPDQATTIRIDGTGPVALACALLLLRQGFAADEIALTLPSEPPPAELIRRAIATSHGSWLTLGRIVPLPATAVISRVEVRIPGQSGLLTLAAAELGVPALGHVVRYGELAAALRNAAVSAGLGATRSVPDQDAEIIIDAGGDPGQDSKVRDFGQSALLADVAAEGCADDCALEWFTANGPIALLPHPEPGRFSLVWCGTPEDTERRLRLDPQGFVAELAATMAGGARSDAPGGAGTPAMQLVGQPYSVALTRRARRKLVSGKVVAIGNAAQALHPVGAQGLNLGFRDAFELAQCLGDARAAGRELAGALGPYTRSRGLDRRAVIAATDTLAVAFRWPRLHPLQSFALGALAHLPLTRRALVRAFMFGLR